jgi:hypothetical protein
MGKRRRKNKNTRNTPEKADNAINNFRGSVSRIRAKHKNLDMLDMSDVRFSQLAKFEHAYIELIRRARKLMKSRAFIKFHSNVAAAKDEIDSALFDIREKYITKMSAAYKYNIDINDILDMPEYNDFKFSVRDLIFKKIVGDIIPEHPKDEFKRARELKRHFVIHCGETNTGKTYHALQALKNASAGVYLAPLRLLALQVFQTLNDDGVPCTLSTGEEDIITPGAGHISSTIEKLDLDKIYDVAVIDEAQMISDKQRGSAWTKALLGVLAERVHVCCSANAVSLLAKLITDCGDSYEVLQYFRDTELVMDEKNFSFPHNVKRGDALIVFSKKMVLAVSSALAERGKSASVIYGDLPPETRRKQMKMFAAGETDIVVTTDAIGMGLNLPVKRIIFMETKKFDGEESRQLFISEIKQISGRAGRKNIYDTGYVNSLNPGDKEYISDALKSPLPDLESAYYIPLEKYVLSLPMGTLEERLLCCMDARAGIDYIHKADIEQPLKLLRIITGEQLSLTIEEMCRLIFIPFDEGNGRLIRQWLNYIKAYVENGDFSVPGISSETLEELEFYYKSLDLYYSFCKTMGIEFDKDKVMRLKYRTAEKIHDILKTAIKTMRRKCRRCGAKLEWNFRHSICDNCHEGRQGE